jgi:hypothetical protein
VARGWTVRRERQCAFRDFRGGRHGVPCQRCRILLRAAVLQKLVRGLGRRDGDVVLPTVVEERPGQRHSIHCAECVADNDQMRPAVRVTVNTGVPLFGSVFSSGAPRLFLFSFFAHAASGLRM